jgi:hypothetical protein
MTQPLFIFGLPRSYTSLIAGMLGQHPQAYGLPELSLFIEDDLLDMWRDGENNAGVNKYQRHGILRAVAEIYAGEQTINTVDMARHWLAARQSMTTVGIFQELQKKLPHLMLIEKSPVHVSSPTYLQRILKGFPNASFLHLTRHPTNQGVSVMNIKGGNYALAVNSIDYTETEAFVDPQIAWHDINVSIMDLLKDVPEQQKMRIRGEDVMADPREHLGRICRWLGLRDDLEALEDMLHPELSPYACIGPINAMFGNDINFLRDAVFKPHTPKLPSLRAPLPWRDDGASLKPEVQKLAMEFGYSN